MRIFISYSHDSVEHQQKVLAFANELRADGIDAQIDQYEKTPPEGWPLWMEKQIELADYVAMVCSEGYALNVAESPSTGRGVKWEGSLIYQYLYAAGLNNDKFIPVILEQSDAKYIPAPISAYTYYCIGAQPGYYDLYRRITGQPSPVRPQLGKLRRLDIDDSALLHGISVFLCHSAKDKATVISKIRH